MECRADGRVALITGSSRGLGRAMAMALAGAGAHVCITGRRAEVVEETRKEVVALARGKVTGCAADIGTLDGVASAVETAERELGPVDILINNAGTSRRMPFMEITDALWSEDLELKLFGAIRATRRVFPGMVERRWGRIVNVLNTGAKAPPAGGAPTAVSRAAGMALTKVLAGEGTYEEYLEGMARDLALPMGRLGTAEEFANLACFLCSDAGSYINGCAINVDGGMSPVV